MNAASITRPVRAVLDSFAARTGARYAQQPGASLELARLITETHRRPDVLIVADPQVFPSFLQPAYVGRYEIVARNRIVLAYTSRSRNAARIDSGNWISVITQPDVEVGRADPNTDPSGYRALLVMRLAEQHYGLPGLYDRLLAASPARNVRPRESDQIALLQTHSLDYIWTYQNLAEDNGLEYVKLPDPIDLGAAADSAFYARATVRVLGKRPGDTLTIRGAPILFGAAALTTAPHPELAARFLAFLMSAEGRRIARANHFDVLDRPLPVDTFPSTLSLSVLERVVQLRVLRIERHRPAIDEEIFRVRPRFEQIARRHHDVGHLPHRQRAHLVGHAVDLGGPERDALERVLLAQPEPRRFARYIW
jgi:molybdate/tungstate transport system substrate-binding protein